MFLVDSHLNHGGITSHATLLTGVSFITMSEELNGRGPKNEAPNQRGIKIKPQMETGFKIIDATTHHYWTE